MTPVVAELLLIPLSLAVLGLNRPSREPAGGQCQAEFDWGGRPERVSDTRSKSSQNGRKPFAERKGRRGLDCDTDGWSRYESRTQ